MSTENSTVAPEVGCSFLVRDVTDQEIFTPEQFTSEQRMFEKTARDFIANEVLPVSDRIEGKDLELCVHLLGKAGELGLLMGDIPEEFGGMALDKASTALLAESVTGQGSYVVWYLVHTGIGSLPIIYYGTQEQKEKFLPGMADGTLLGCYGLTEASAGSDALAARTRAILSEDGTHYVLNGAKQFITTARVADVLTIFAKVDGQHFTGFLVEKGTPGLSFGPDEHKMGILGTTTSTILMEDVRVPVENVLGQVGQGHKIAFNILNIGRFKLGAVCVGHCKRVLEYSLAYTLERKQFNTRIADFGAIREKLAQMFAYTYAAEAAVYRTVGQIDRLLASAGEKFGEAGLRSIEEYSVECSICKVLGSEIEAFVVDEAVQCFGGYGFCDEYPVEAFYRNARINRIYEGTNEINRMIIPTMLLRKAGTGVLPLFEAAGALESVVSDLDGILAAERALVANLKALTLWALTFAAERCGKGLSRQQEIQLRLADLVIQIFAAESAVLRAGKDAGTRGEDAAALPLAAARLTCVRAADVMRVQASQIVSALADAEEADELLDRVETACRYRGADVVALQQTIAARLVEMERLVL